MFFGNMGSFEKLIASHIFWKSNLNHIAILGISFLHLFLKMQPRNNKVKEMKKKC